MGSLLDVKTVRGLTSRYGTQWVERLPDLVGSLIEANNWTLRSHLPGGRTACVLIVETSHGLAVLKVSPDLTRSRREVAALHAMEAHQVGPQVIDYWEESHSETPSSVLLMELLGSGGSIRDCARDNIPVDTLAKTLRKITKCGECPLEVDLDSLKGPIEKRLTNPEWRGSRGAPRPSEADITDARSIFRDLMASTAGTWIHGTLHPGNLIFTESRVLAIDPRPFAAGPAYDAAELSLKWGSERNGRRHNLEDGRQLWRDLRPHIGSTVEDAAVDAWMRVLVTTAI
ncbi:phosphotransferase [Streptomyces sp. NPDC056549]|uniref:phosphotransferase n=1 Tax=Streptomyces sp. NPDC056549 TaxID=3345864 RepID=UPI0036A33C08